MNQKHRMTHSVVAEIDVGAPQMSPRAERHHLSIGAIAAATEAGQGE